MTSDILKVAAEEYPQILASIVAVAVIPFGGSLVFTRMAKGFFLCTKEQGAFSIFMLTMLALVITWIIVNAPFVPDWMIAIAIVLELAGILTGRWIQRAYQDLGYVEVLR